jgi:ubiquinone/menaquinone biosynthesis C-methylase UbiE
MMKRIATAELLDSDAGTPREIAASLRDLDRINIWFGGDRASASMIRSIAQRTGKTDLTLLEVAAGSGRSARRVAELVRRQGINVSLTLLDRRASHVSESSGIGNAQVVVADALSLPFADASFDITSCSLFTHHLSEPQVVQFANEALRVTRTAVIINDLVRHPLHYVTTYAGLPLFRSRITWNDAPASVRQSYRRNEMRQLLSQVRSSRFEINSHYLFRMGAILWK